MSLFIVGLVVFSFVVNVVVAEVATDNAEDVLENWLNRNLGEGTLKYVILVLVILLVYAGFHTMDFPENKALAFALSVVIGFLATYLLDINQIKTIMLSYGGLGFVGALFLPIIALVFISY